MKNNKLITSLLILLFLLAAVSASFVLIVRNLILTVDNNSLVSAIQSVPGCSTANYADYKFYYHQAYLNLANYLVYIGLGTSGLGMWYLIIFLVRNRNDFSEQKIQVMKKTTIILALLTCLTMGVYLGYVTSFYIDINNVSCGRNLFNFTNYQTTFVPLLICASGAVVFGLISVVVVSRISSSDQEYLQQQNVNQPIKTMETEPIHHQTHEVNKTNYELKNNHTQEQLDPVATKQQYLHIAAKAERSSESDHEIPLFVKNKQETPSFETTNRKKMERPGLKTEAQINEQINRKIRKIKADKQDQILYQQKENMQEKPYGERYKISFSPSKQQKPVIFEPREIKPEVKQTKPVTPMQMLEDQLFKQQNKIVKSSFNDSPTQKRGVLFNKRNRRI